jgi:hypothetical protein
VDRTERREGRREKRPGWAARREKGERERRRGAGWAGPKGDKRGEGKRKKKSNCF